MWSMTTTNLKIKNSFNTLERQVQTFAVAIERLTQQN